MATNTPANGSVTNAMLAGSIATSKLAEITKNGITEVDQWRVTSTVSTSSTVDITTNLARMSGDGFGFFGTGMSQSSGVFTFPSTGYWYVSFKTQGRSNGGTVADAGGRIRVSTNGGSSYSNYSFAQQSTSADVFNFSTYTNAILDVTDVSQIKIIFSYTTGSAVYFDNDATQGYTQMTFMKLGET